ncbi:MAG: bifunctional phosphoglucose/phosphomannose isomerase [Chitinophagales bacterium]
MMQQLIKDFPMQVLRAMEIGKKIQLDTAKSVEIKNILVIGLGGSGAGANIVIQLLQKELAIPMLVNKDYDIPRFVNENTLLIASSYSGNTEETISALEQAIKQNTQIVGVTTGGKLEEMALQYDFPIVKVPSGMPPRTALGYSLVQQLYILHHFNLISKFFEANLQAAYDLLMEEQEAIKLMAKSWAEILAQKTLVIYTATQYEALGLRWRQQMNENAKMLCWHNVLPEMNHNELVGWREETADKAVIFVYADDVFERTTYRFEIVKKMVAKYASCVLDFETKGNSMIERYMYGIHFGDWLSFYLSQIRGFDAMEIEAIDFLKQSLSEMEV